MIKVDEIPDDDTIVLEKVICTYSQAPDCCSDEDEYQELTIETRNGGGGNFYNFSTYKTGWSICSLEDLKEVFEDFKKRSNEFTDNS